MASSSSAKKVARVAARSGSGAGSSAGKAATQRNWLFALAIVAIVALGVGAVAFARARNEGLGKNDTKPRARIVEGEPFDHWHAAFAFEVCGKELPAVTEVDPDIQGIHTHGDGLIHIHPFTTRAAGKRATLGKFWSQTKIKVTDDGFQTQTGEVYKEGATTCPGAKDTEVVLAYWKDAATAAGKKPDKIYRKDFAAVRFTSDLSAYTLALIPKGADDEIEAPTAAADIAQLGQADAGAAPVEDSTTAPADEPTTTAPAGDATTTAPAGDATTSTEAAG